MHTPQTVMLDNFFCRVAHHCLCLFATPRLFKGPFSAASGARNNRCMYSDRVMHLARGITQRMSKQKVVTQHHSNHVGMVLSHSAVLLPCHR